MGKVRGTPTPGASAHREIEAKLEVPSGVALPDLTRLPGVAAVDDPEQFTLEAVYLDTPDLRLAKAGTTLRRRTGGVDPGWHVKMRVSADERTELHGPLGAADGEVPAELAAAVRAQVRGAPLSAVVTLRTRRTVRRLRDAADQVLAEVADDVVTSRSPGQGEVVLDAWREWEVELVHGDRHLLAATVKRLQKVDGAVPGRSSKLARALDRRLADAAAVPGRRPAAAGSAGAAVGEHLAGLREDLLAHDPQVRRDEPEGVHQMRVATRRLRSTLATFSPLLVRGQCEGVRVELGWLAGLLGAARDAEVGRQRLTELLAPEPPELVLGLVARRLDGDRAAAYRFAHQLVLEALDSDRYFRLLDALDALVDAPPLTKVAGGAAGRVLPARVRRDWERLARAFELARNTAPGPRRDELLHAARKAAKRTRYAAEAVAPTAGRPAEKFAVAAKKLQTLLGDHHDTVEIRAVLRRVGVQAHLDGENAFTYGRLHAIEQARAERIEVQLPAAWDRVSASRRRRWMG